MPITDTHLEHARVRDVMHTGVLTTDDTTPLRIVARLMAEQQVHAVAVSDRSNSRRPWGLVTDLDIVRAAAGDDDMTAAEAVSDQMITISSSESLMWAAHLMATRGQTHLLVLDAGSAHVSGIVSSLDIAAAYAG